MHIADIEPDFLKVVLDLANAANDAANHNLDGDIEARVNDALCALPKDIRILLDSPVLTVEEWDGLIAEHDAITDEIYHVEPS